MKTTAHKSALKKATLFAAIGTTLYTLFVPIFGVTFYDKIDWLNFQEHPWLNNAWFLFFDSVLLLSWAAFALGVIRDGEHFPPINRWVRYASLVLAIGLIPFSYFGWWVHPYIRPHIALVCVLNSIYAVFLWYLYARTSSVNSATTPSCSLRWARCVCWIVFVFILALMLDCVAALVDYARGVLDNALYYIEIARQMWYWTNSKCNLLCYIIPLTFSLCLFLQPIINRRESKQLAATDSKQATEDTTTDSSDHRQTTDAQSTIEK